jgi:hypothetical protein
VLRLAALRGWGALGRLSGRERPSLLRLLVVIYLNSVSLMSADKRPRAHLSDSRADFQKGPVWTMSMAAAGSTFSQ